MASGFKAWWVLTLVGVLAVTLQTASWQRVKTTLAMPQELRSDRYCFGDSAASIELESQLFRSRWLPADERELLPLEFSAVNQSRENIQFAELKSKPQAVIFFYSRCDNPNRCVRAIAGLQRIRNALAKRGLAHAARLTAITFDPQFDSPTVLESYARKHGLSLDDDLQLISPQTTHLKFVIEMLFAPVNFSQGRVNTHGIALYILDHRGRIARQYHSVIWPTEAVVQDLEKLIAEASSAHESR
jgi:cytochrome oxidase Cu insertion factor (SCO1/SenC/PrrC family)